MNEPKFKVWCCDKNEWERDVVYLSEDGSQYHTSRLSYVKPDRHIVVFDTTVRDSNNKPIYDGDILLECKRGSDQERYGVVALRQGCWCVEYKGVGSYTIFDRMSKDNCNLFVVGNKFEHSELLKRVV